MALWSFLLNKVFNLKSCSLTFSSSPNNFWFCWVNSIICSFNLLFLTWKFLLSLVTWVYNALTVFNLSFKSFILLSWSFITSLICWFSLSLSPLQALSFNILLFKFVFSHFKLAHWHSKFLFLSFKSLFSALFLSKASWVLFMSLMKFLNLLFKFWISISFSLLLLLSMAISSWSRCNFLSCSLAMLFNFLFSLVNLFISLSWELLIFFNFWTWFSKSPLSPRLWFKWLVKSLNLFLKSFNSASLNSISFSRASLSVNNFLFKANFSL